MDALTDVIQLLRPQTVLLGRMAEPPARVRHVLVHPRTGIVLLDILLGIFIGGFVGRIGGG